MSAEAGPVAAARTQLVALVGPPNSGKSTLFNRLTGLRQKVANYPGVTVERRIGRARVDESHEVSLIDLPGIYNLDPTTEDERVTHDVLTGKMADVPRPDAILLILDSTNLARNLSLAAPILALQLPTLLVLNMADDLESRGGAVDTKLLAAQLGTPVVLISAATGQGVELVTGFLSQKAMLPRPVELPVLQSVPQCREWAAKIGHGAKYRAPAPPIWTRRLDRLFLHPLLGPLVFLVVVGAVFQSIFHWAEPAMRGLEALIGLAAKGVEATMPASPVRALLVEGVLGGVGSVVVFLPQILLLFLFIAVLEDSGYLARAALIADRTMARAGLQGKSFIPLLSAYACAVPAILATRTIENKRDRIATILIAPLMTCSARLPVYTLVIAAFIPERPFFGPLLGTRAAALFALYVAGFLAAVVTARVLKSSVLKSHAAPFVLEMPPYRWPTFRSVGLRLFDRAIAFLKRAGTVILVMTVVFWLLAHLPVTNGQAPPIEESIAGKLGHAIEPVIRPLGFNWKIGVGLLSSIFAAREVIVGTLATLYKTEGGEESAQLREALQRDLSLGGAWALLVFFAFAMQCVSTIAVVRRETASWRWPAIQFGFMTGLAYVCAFLTHEIVNWLAR